MTRWNGHRSYWNKFEHSEHNDKSSLLMHFAKHHPVVLKSNPTLPNCLEVIFIEQPKDTSSLDCSFLYCIVFSIDPPDSHESDRGAMHREAITPTCFRRYRDIAVRSFF